MDIRVWFAYLVTEFVLSITPGPAVMLVSSQGLRHGTRQSVFGSLGISSGNLVYFVLSAVGLGAVLLSAGSLFRWITYAGAAYLVITGVSTIVATFKPHHESGQEVVPQDESRSFLQGFVTQISNPKALLFFAALLPQFVDTTRNTTLQFMIFGLTTILMETWILIGYGWMSANGKTLFRNVAAFSLWRDRLAGVVLTFIGLALAFR